MQINEITAIGCWGFSRYLISLNLINTRDKIIKISEMSDLPADNKADEEMINAITYGVMMIV